MNNRILAIFAALSATSIFGLNHTITKNLMPFYITPSGLLFARVFGACTLFWIISVFSKHEKIVRVDLRYQNGLAVEYKEDSRVAGL